jgi:hypothetical protein
MTEKIKKEPKPKVAKDTSAPAKRTRKPYF